MRTVTQKQNQPPQKVPYLAGVDMLRQSHSASPGVSLQSAAGNSPLASFATPGLQLDFARIPLSAPQVQCKLAINSPDDPFEREADAVAERVMRMPDPRASQQPWSPVAPPSRLQRKCAKCEEEEKEKHQLQRQETGAEPAGVPPIVHEVLNSPGQPLDAATRDFMEPRFGYDFTGVRVHTDAKASESASVVSALAYTVGSNIVFAGGQYVPRSVTGQRLLAHELTHVVQQANVSSSPPLKGDLDCFAANDTQTIRSFNHSVGLRQNAAITIRPEAPTLQRDAADDQARNNATSPVADTPTAGPATPTGDGAGAGGSSKLDIEFNAFIDGALGARFDSFAHPLDLSNQTAFDAALKAVPGSWLEEPGTFQGLNTGPWCYASDNRSFGGGSHRVGFKGSLRRSDIGVLASKAMLFNHDTSGSEHVRWTHTGTFTSEGEKGSRDGPHSASAKVSSSEEHIDNSADASKVTTKGAAGYPFKALSPDIDYKLVFDFKRESGGKTGVAFEVTNNKFPYYELLLNGGTVWSYKSKDSGPGPINLNSSETFKSGYWYF